MRPRVTIVGGGLAGAMGLFMYNRLSAAGQAQQQAPDAGMGGMPPGKVRVASSRNDTIQQRFRVVGRLREIRRATVSSEISGRLIEVPVEEGDVVTGGKTVLGKIDDIWAKADLADAEAQVAEAQSSLAQAKQDFEMLEELQKALSAKPREVQEAGHLVAQREAKLKEAIALRDRRKEEVERVTIIAPFDGVVVRKDAEVGQWVAPGTPVAEGAVVARIAQPDLELKRDIARAERADTLRFRDDLIRFQAADDANRARLRADVVTAAHGFVEWLLHAARIIGEQGTLNFDAGSPPVLPCGRSWRAYSLLEKRKCFVGDFLKTKPILTKIGTKKSQSAATDPRAQL